MKRGTPGHIKTKRLARALGLPQYAAVGLLECLFHLVMAQARAGNVGRLSDEEIVLELGYDGAMPLVPALVSSGWLDVCPCHRLRVHDWPDHADQTTTRQAAKEGGFLSCYQSIADVSRQAGEKKPSVDVDVDVDVDRAVVAPNGAPSSRGVFVKAVWTAFCEVTGRDPEQTCSPADWHVACGWFDDGTPLAIVLRAIKDCLGSSPEKRPRAMAYLVPAVSEANRHRQKALA